MNQKRRFSAPENISKSEIPGLRDHLNRSDLFSACSKEVQDDLMKHFHFRHFGKGEILIQSGNKASTLFILLKGSVQVVSERYEAVLAELGPGMIFGEIVALFGIPRTASVIAKSIGLVAVIDKISLKKVIGVDKKLWDHIKGIAFARYRLTEKQTKKCQVSWSEKESYLLHSDSFKQVPVELMRKLSELTEVEEFKAEVIVDYFSPRIRHVLYMIKEGTVMLNYLSAPSKTLTTGQVFKSYEYNLDFVKTLTDKTILYEIDVQQASALFAQYPDSEIQEIGESLFETTHLTDQIDANSSITMALSSGQGQHQVNDLSSIINSAQFSKHRRNSTPVFSDLCRENSFKFVGERLPISRDVATTSSKLVNTDNDLKLLLFNAGIVVPESVTLLFEDRLTLTSLKNELTDSILLAVASVLGSQITVLNLTDCHLLTSPGILAIWLKCPHLIKISLQGCWNLDDSAFSTLSRCPCSETLKDLNLAHCWRLTPKVLSLIGPGVTKLDLSYCKSLDDRTWPALTQFSQTLRCLRLRRCLAITDSSFEGIFGVQFTELEYLDLGECSFLTDSSITGILSSAPNLRTLNLSFSTSIKGTFLLHHDFLPHLRVLTLSYLSKVVDKSFCFRLVKVCRNLEELYLDGCSFVDDECVANFINENLPNLRVLNLNNCPLVSKIILDRVNLKFDDK
jgi:CRP-like cAMP-binding protein